MQHPEVLREVSLVSFCDDDGDNDGDDDDEDADDDNNKDKLSPHCVTMMQG